MFGVNLCDIFIVWRGYCRWQYARAAVLLPLAIRMVWHGYVLELGPLRALTVLAQVCALAIALARIRPRGGYWRMANTPPVFCNPIPRA